MTTQVLALDQGYVPVATIPWQRAVTLWYQGKAEVVEVRKDLKIRSVSITIEMPSVIRFLSKIVKRRKQIKFSRINVYERDDGRCQYCMNRVTKSEATYDHVVPRKQGGQTTWTNIVIACVSCNQKKGARRPEQAGMSLRKKPVRPKKLPHYRFHMQWNPGMPDSWRTWLQSISYWNSDLSE